MPGGGALTGVRVVEMVGLGPGPFAGMLLADLGAVAVGAIEPQFYAALLKGLGLDDEDPAEQWDPTKWPDKKRRFADVIASRTRDELVDAFDGLDACVAPALDPVDATTHPHAVARGQFFTDAHGSPQPMPAPRFDRTPTTTPVDHVDTDLATVLADWSK